MGSDSPSARVQHAIAGAQEERLEGHPDDALRRLTGAAALLGAGRVKRALAVALCRERGLCHVALNEPDDAWQAFEDGLDLAGRDDALADPLVAAEATLDLMTGHTDRAQARLAAGDQTRRASLVAQARLHLLIDRTDLAETTLQACEQAPGGSSDLAPPSAVLRSLVALWDGRPGAARMLYDGVGTPNNPHWELVRILVMRSQWVATGDARYLVLAQGAAEELRAMTAVATIPGLHAAACGHHAVLMALSGQLALALEAADEALGAMGTMSLPEWPHAAVLHDLAVVLRDAGATDRHQRVLELAAREDVENWLERMRLVTGPRADRALVDIVHPGRRATDREHQLAMTVLANPQAPRAGLLRGVTDAVRAHGARWTDEDGTEVAAIGTAWSPEDEDGEIPVRLPSGETLHLRGASLRDLEGLALDEIATLAAHASGLARDRADREALMEQLEQVLSDRRRALTALERARRGAGAATLGGTFPTVAGRSQRITQALDQLALLAKTELPVLLVGPHGAGRRHLARAFAGLVDGTHGRSAIIDMAIVPEALRAQALGEAIASAGDATLILANAEHLGAQETSRLLGQIDDGTLQTRLVVTLDEDDERPVARAWRDALCAGRVRVAGLGERMEDLPVLVDTLAASIGLRPDQVGDQVRTVLGRRAWPGHCSELRSVLADASVRCGDGPVLPEHLGGDDDTDRGLARGLHLGYHDAVRGFRRDLLRHALEKTEGNRTQAAKMLGVQRTYFMRLIRDLGADDIPPGA